MTSIEHYNSLEINKKAELLWEYGQYFDERIEYGKFQYKYYYVCNCNVPEVNKAGEFVVELKYNIKKNCIEAIEAMKQSYRMDFRPSLFVAGIPSEYLQR